MPVGQCAKVPFYQCANVPMCHFRDDTAIAALVLF
jgi:hypothetical protein